MNRKKASDQRVCYGPGCLARSLAGHDKGRLYVILGEDGDVDSGTICLNRIREHDIIGGCSYMIGLCRLIHLNVCNRVLAECNIKF